MVRTLINDARRNFPAASTGGNFFVIAPCPQHQQYQYLAVSLGKLGFVASANPPQARMYKGRLMVMLHKGETASAADV